MSPHPTHLLTAWEEGEEQHPLDRALTLLRVADPDATPDGLARLPVAARDARLLAFHEALAGPVLEGFAACPECGEGIAVALDARALAADAPDPDASWTVEADGRVVDVRLPDSHDLAAAAACADAAAGRVLLAQRCAGAEGLSEAAVVAIAERLGEVAGPAELLVDLTCPACEHAFQRILDIAVFVWREVAAEARRLLHEVDGLARAYGWSEAEVLALPRRRRHRYLELAL